ncbi:Starch-binding associating with outer membrane [Arenibacter nanhaiticus]|uniref:Starch-binding associating with outer membrane n=1 Tax=Arenibacter nanhaiticus TaxID=558155 RepID=A0A1M6BZL1_9FLAO|nr:RagB/SusD family nutrient uptake outer membrane protein [Arenibacter nanhaiticus]SHI54216.1 Starch-binding associating with outer membrane [Arenibacter nanhaiticus]
MKTIKLLVIILSATIFGCSEEFLDRPDLDSISTDSFWKTPNDLNLYITQYYTVFPGWGPNQYSGGIYWEDSNSDNIAPNNVNSRLAGFNTLESSNGSWSFSSVRTINIFLSKYQEVLDNGHTMDDIAQYVGEGHFFRAYFYYDLLRNYGDVPWFGASLVPSSEELYAARDPRNVVVDNILADLDKAIANLPSGRQSNGNRLCKEIALLFKARVALYEGTWEKYHAGTPFTPEDSNPNKYLSIAQNTAELLINEPADFGIANSGNPSFDYSTLFNQTDYSSNPEVLMWRNFDVSQGVAHNGQRYLPRIGGGRGLTKELLDQYLCSDGLPIGLSPLYQGDQGLENLSTNRDPRLSETVFLPGDPMRIDATGAVTETFEKAPLGESGDTNCPTGYMIFKGSNSDIVHFQTHSGTTSSPIFRFAEVLLILAEAKAELGTITQSDVDKTINVLRDRAGMPDLNIESITIDPNWQFPSLSPLINEIRRERHIELAAEGYRFDDILRWAAADELIVGKRLKGIFFQQSVFPDLVVGTDVLLDADGYVDLYQMQVPNGNQFDVNRDYLLPIPQEQLTINPNLTQNPGWNL